MNKRISILFFPLMVAISFQALGAEPDSSQDGSQSTNHPTAAELHRSNPKADNKNKQTKIKKKTKDAEAPSEIVVPQ